PDGDLDLDLGQEAHGVFGTAIDLALPLLPAEALHFAGSEPVNAERGQRFAHLVQLERLDDCDDEFHLAWSPTSSVLPDPVEGATQESCRGDSVQNEGNDGSRGGGWCGRSGFLPKICSYAARVLAAVGAGRVDLDWGGARKGAVDAVAE